MVRKDLIVAVILTFCLTATLFWVVPTRSQTYDPWADYNGDGKINILDIVPIAISFGASGDPTKNVTIAGHANILAFTIQDQPVPAGESYATPWISVDGYSKLTVCIETSIDLNMYQLHCAHDNRSTTFLVEKTTNILYDLVKTYDVPNRLVRITFRNDAPLTPHSVSIDVYLIP